MNDDAISVVPYPLAKGGFSGDPDERVLTIESSERWVRGVIGAMTVVDCKHPMLLWEPGFTSSYVFPERDVRADLLEPVPAPTERLRLGAAQWYDLVLDGRRYEHLAWRYEVGPLEGYLGIDWFGRRAPGIDHWYEEQEEVFVHPRSPHCRVDPLPSNRHVAVSVGDRLLADTTSPVLLFETGLPVRYYIPPADVDFEQLERTELRTRCPFKGIATYWSVRDYDRGKDIVWSYEQPIDAALAIRDHLSFYNEVVDITVDGEPLKRPETHFIKRLDADAPDVTGV